MKYTNNKIQILALIFCCIAHLLSAQSVAVKLNLTDFVRGVGGNIEVSKSKHLSLLEEFQYLNFDRHRYNKTWLFNSKGYEYWLNMKGWRNTILLRYYTKNVHDGLFFEAGPYIGLYKGDLKYHQFKIYIWGPPSDDYTELNTSFRNISSGFRAGWGAQVRNRYLLYEFSCGLSINTNSLNEYIRPFSQGTNFYLRGAIGFVKSKQKPAPRNSKYIWFSGK